MTAPQPSAGRGRGRRVLLVGLVVLVGAVATGVAWQEENDQATRAERSALRRGADRLVALTATIEASFAGSSGIVQDDGTVDADAFEAFALDLTETSEITALALELVVPAEDRPAFEARLGRPIRDRGEGGPTTSPARSVHYPVLTVAPVSDTSDALLGFDLASDPVRRRAAETARDAGRLVFSQPLPSEPTGSLSFFVIQPIYDRGGPYETVAERRRHIVGFASTAYGSTGLAGALDAALPDGARFEVRDEGALLAASEVRPASGSERSVEAADRTWVLVVDAGAGPDHGVAFLLGVLTGLLAVGLTYELVRTARHTRVLGRSASRADQLATLAEELAGTTSLAEVAEVVTTIGRLPVEATATSVGLIEGDTLRVVHGDTVPQEYQSDWPNPSLDAPLAFTHAARTGQTLLFEDQASYEEAFPAVGGPAAGARAALPLRRPDGTTVGAIVHLWAEDRHFDEAMRSTLRTIADLTGQALERARLGAIKQEAASHSEALAQLAQGLATRRSSEDVMQFLTEGVLAPLGAVHAAVGVIDGDQLQRHYTPGARTDLLAALLPSTVPLDSDSPLAEAARTGQPVLLGTTAAMRDRYPDVASGWEAIGFQSLANLPLRDRRGDPIGALGVAWDAPVDLDDIRDRLTTIAGIAGQTLDRALLSDAEHRLVRSFQAGLLEALPPHPHLATAERYLPATQSVGMGGDWYDGIVRTDGRYVIVVGDVAGHGIPAVSQMAQLRSVIGAMAALELPVGEVFARTTVHPHQGEPLIASAVLVQIDADASALHYACAGHPPPLLRQPDGTVVVLGDGRQPLLGLEVESVEAGVHPFPVGATLVAYTDGLVERRSEPIDESIQRLAGVLAEIGSPDPDGVADALLDQCLDGEPTDDVAVVVVVRIA